MKKLSLILIAAMFLQKANAQHPAPEWSKASTIYEVNIRQYTPEGTFEAFTAHIPRLHAMGADILWLMPVQPIGQLNRKGSLGSYYSISDYTATNPEFGTMKDFKKLVDEAHQNNMHVILDWVGNHTAWDHAWMKSHNDYYTAGKDGSIIPPVADWSDVADLNFDNKEMRKAMIDAMKFWINEANIDGFRCDVAMMIPDDFWKEAFSELRKTKPDVFLLCEAEGPQFIRDGFHMVYGWERHHALNKVAQGKAKAPLLDSLIRKDLETYPAGSYYMNFTSNHDENSWNGTEFERMGDAVKTCAVVAATMPGMLLIYSGQEVAMNKRLRFFDKDTISWVDDRNYTAFYSELIKLKKANPALWNGTYGGDYKELDDKNSSVFSFARLKDDNRVLVFANFSNERQEVTIEGYAGKYKMAVSGKKEKLKAKDKLEIPQWGYIVLYN